VGGHVIHKHACQHADHRLISWQQISHAEMMRMLVKAIVSMLECC
jgi:hypothetical protein